MTKNGDKNTQNPSDNLSAQDVAKDRKSVSATASDSNIASGSASISKVSAETQTQTQKQKNAAKSNQMIDDFLGNATTAHMETDSDTNNKIKKCGYVALVGPTNAGKSTLVNYLTGHKVAIVSRKVQTTRTRITAITTHETDDVSAQLIFLDTPGLFKPRKKLDRAMIQAAESSMQEADLVALLIDVSKPEHIVLDNVRDSLQSLQRNAQGKTIALVLNKIDQTTHQILLQLTTQIAEEHGDAIDSVFMISARTGDGVKEFLSYCTDYIPTEKWLFSGDEISTMPFRLMAAEITRETVMDLVHQEIPYAVTVVTEDVEPFDNGDYKISQLIIVEKKSQKTVLVGRAGSKIKEIGQKSRYEMARIFDGKIHLKLLVKVQANWQDDPEYYTLWNLGQ